ncbi:MAG: hypothetical protein HQL99_08355 [Magnetococcales bacterium]|nr:hypothetical protein [Magnetococcales bacterium]
MPLLSRMARMIGLILLLTGHAQAAMHTEQLPEPLKPWVHWALHGHEQNLCPMAHDNASSRWCHWSSRLSLTLEKNQGRFTLQARVVGHNLWLPLPGDQERWPREVKVDDKPAIVTAQNGIPGVWLNAGSHTLSGEWRYAALPEYLKVPEEVGLITLSVEGQGIPSAAPDHAGRLWLHPKNQTKRDEDRLEMSVQRLVRDGVPLTLETRIELRVSGKQREILLAPSVSADWMPIGVNAPLPIRLEPDGGIRIQVKAGVWPITLEQRLPGPVGAIERPAAALPPWPEEEAWAFAASPRLRVVTVGGVDAVDPRQTALPQAWHTYPAYRMRPGDRMELLETKRGASDPLPERMTLHRTLWLDFSGAGWTIQDRIQGTGMGSWRLEMNPPMALGRVMIDGENQFITRMPDSTRSGVELRDRQVKVSAESRLPLDSGVIPATGWNQDFQKVTGTAHLPPGWRLLHATGVDRSDATWIGQWTLLDFFLTLVVSLAAGRLWGRVWGGVALVALGLIHPEQPALAWSLLAIMGAVAALRVVPANGWPARLLGAWRMGAWLVMAALLLPFLIDQARQGIHPQLEKNQAIVPMPQAAPQRTTALRSVEVPRMAPEGERTPAAMAALEPDQNRERDQAREQEQTKNREQAQTRDQARHREQIHAKAKALPATGKPDAPSSSVSLASSPAPARAKLTGLDPKAVAQTGPGVPQWHWHQVSLHWNGPVTRDQEWRLYLLPPWANRLVILARILLALAMMARVMELAALRTPPGRAGAGASMLLLVLGLSGSGWAGAIPDQKMLDTLSSRLLEPPACLPDCATLNRLRLEADPERLRLHLEFHAPNEVAVPLPGQAGHWLPTEVWLDGKPAVELKRLNQPADRPGTLWMVIPAGIHAVMLEGPLATRETVQLSLPLGPKLAVADSQSWKVEGIHDNGAIDSTWQLRRIHTGAPGAGESREAAWSEAVSLPPYLEVERRLTLGLTWEVETEVRRVTREESAVGLELPLLAGEAVTTHGIRVTEGKARVRLDPGQQQLQWHSTLPLGEQLILSAARETLWHEIWRLRAAPWWHVTLEGIPVTAMTDDAGGHQPEWRPWPGEEVRVRVLRPQGVDGATLTLERSELSIKPGERATDATLGMTLQASHGGQHVIRLPESAKLLSAHIDGREEPLRQDGRQVTLPVAPGSHEVRLHWRQPEGMTERLVMPRPDLGLEGVNATARITLPPDRWILWVRGPTMGPAVLYWGALGVILLLAAGLGRIPWLPLKTRHWALLGLGLSTVETLPALILVGWFLLMGWRGAHPESASRWRFNGRQIFLLLWTVAAVTSLEEIFRHGLLGFPDMQVAGNLSTPQVLQWFQDRTAAEWPIIEVISLPISAYRLLMLLWSLWLAAALLGWIRWAWTCLSRDELWRGRVISPTPPAQKSPDTAKTIPDDATGSDVYDPRSSTPTNP